MVDGKRSSADLLAVLSGIGANQDQLQQLEELGLIQGRVELATSPASKAGTSLGGAAQDMGAQNYSDQDRYQLAYPIATRLTSGLGLRGFRLNLSVEGASNIADLLALAGKIREAVGDEKYADLKRILGQ